jgi:hypothetical protein
MRQEIGYGQPLSEEEAYGITDEAEKIFALRCLEKGILLYHQVEVGNSVIDFLVVNPKAVSPGKIVEVTMQKKEDLEKKTVTIGEGKNKRTVPNKTGFRKQRQIESMKQSGWNWTILMNEEMKRLRKKIK